MMVNLLCHVFALFVVLIVVVTSPATNAVAAVFPICNVSSTGFQIYLKSGVRTNEQEMFSERQPIQRLYNGDYVCYENNWGDNIEATMTSSSSSCDSNTNTTLMSFLLQTVTNSNKKVVLVNRTDRGTRYLMYSDFQNGKVVYGKPLLPRKYHLTVRPFQRVPTRRLGISSSIDFEVIDCENYQPPNKCKQCPYDPKNLTYACDGSLCLRDEYLRITLISSGYDSYDYGLTVTSPGPSLRNRRSISAYSGYDPIPANAIVNDALVTGGYVDEDFHYSSCRSYGKWTKSIVFPLTNPLTKVPIQKGMYRISLEDLDVCGFVDDSSPVVNTNPFELKIYHNHKLMKTYTTGRDFNFTLL